MGKKRGSAKRTKKVAAESEGYQWKPVEVGMWEGEVHGYRVLRLRSRRLLYLRRHRGDDTNGEPGLFIGNVSPKVDGIQLQDVLDGEGDVAKGRMGGSGWFVRVGMSAERIAQVLEGDVDVEAIEKVIEDGEIRGGPDVWIREWENERTGVKEWARRVMEEWERKEREEKEKRRKVVTDEDGWTVVRRGEGAGEGRDGRIGGVSRAQAETVAGTKRKQAEARTNEIKDGFYKFQRMAKHRKEIHDLRKRWEEQKEKITAMSRLKS